MKVLRVLCPNLTDDPWATPMKILVNQQGLRQKLLKDGPVIALTAVSWVHHFLLCSSFNSPAVKEFCYLLVVSLGIAWVTQVWRWREKTHASSPSTSGKKDKAVMKKSIRCWFSNRIQWPSNICSPDFFLSVFKPRDQSLIYLDSNSLLFLCGSLIIFLKREV